MKTPILYQHKLAWFLLTIALLPVLVFMSLLKSNHKIDSKSSGLPLKRWVRYFFNNHRAKGVRWDVN